MTLHKNGIVFTLIVIIYLLPDLVLHSLNILPFHLQNLFDRSWFLMGASDYLTLSVFAALTLLAIGDSNRGVIVGLLKMLLLGVCFIVIKFFFGMDESYSLVSVLGGSLLGAFGASIGKVNRYSHMGTYGGLIVGMMVLLMPICLFAQTGVIEMNMEKHYRNFQANDRIFDKLPAVSQETLRGYGADAPEKVATTLVTHYAASVPTYTFEALLMLPVGQKIVSKWLSGDQAKDNPMHEAMVWDLYMGLVTVGDRQLTVHEAAAANYHTGAVNLTQEQWHQLLMTIN